MSVSDPVADFLTCVRNAIRAKHRKVDVPASKLKTEIARVLLRERYINNFKVIEDDKQGILRVYLKYTPDDVPVITGLRRVSTPGRRVYLGKARLPKVLGGLGVLDPVHVTRADDRPRGPRSGSRRRAHLPGLVGGRHVASRKASGPHPERRHGRRRGRASRAREGAEWRAHPPGARRHPRGGRRRRGPRLRGARGPQPGLRHDAGEARTTWCWA